MTTTIDKQTTDRAIRNIGTNWIFIVIKALLVSLGGVAKLTPTPIDNVVLAVLTSVLDAFEQADTKDEASTLVATAIDAEVVA